MKLIHNYSYSTLLFFKLKKKVLKLFDTKNFNAIIKLLNNERLESFRGKQISELFLLRGNAQSNLKKYDDAINDYSIAIKKYPKNALAFYNRATINVTHKRAYEKALNDFKKAIKCNNNKYIFLYSRISIASILRFKKDFNNSINILDNIILKYPNDAKAYYNRGLTKMEGFINWREAINDFKKFLDLTPSDDSWREYATYYINYIEHRLNENLYKINYYITKIKHLLTVRDTCITHYTSLSVLKKLVFDKSKFRLSEGNFLNDSSEGKELFNFLDPSHNILNTNLKDFQRKVFIGSFVSSSNADNLNMWRLYGKENGTEAAGCSISIDIFNFRNALIDSINKDDEGYNSPKDNIDFFI